MAQPYQSVHVRPVAQISVSARLKFLQKVYGWMAAAMVLCGVGTYVSITTGLAELPLRMGFGGAIVMTLAWVGLGWVVNKVRHQPVVNVIAFAAYALFTGFVVSGIVMVAMIVSLQTGGGAMSLVWQAFGITAGMFGGLSIYAITTKRDFSWMRGILVIGMFAVLGLLIVDWFVQSTIFSMAVSFLTIMVFGGFVLYDTQKILREYPENEYIPAAVALFTNFVILFMHILRLLIMLASGRD